MRPDFCDACPLPYPYPPPTPRLIAVVIVKEDKTHPLPSSMYPHQNKIGSITMKKVCVPRFAENAKYVSNTGVRTCSYHHLVSNQVPERPGRQQRQPKVSQRALAAGHGVFVVVIVVVGGGLSPGDTQDTASPTVPAVGASVGACSAIWEV